VSTAHEQDERALVEAAQADPTRFLDLYDRHFHRVYAYVLRRVRNRPDAEDITADVFHRALEHLDRFEWRGTPFVAWLFRIASHALADHWARAGRQGGAPLGAMPASDPELERQVMLFQLVERLPDEQRRVVELRFGEGRSLGETAAAVGKSAGAVKQLQHRAIQNLRKAMEAHHG
jgi:RNA polymerase sigma-70 factor (ECF subfamily)